MSMITNVFRRSLTLLLYRAMGLRIAYWRGKVAALWALGNDQRERYLSQVLGQSKPLAADGSVVRSLDDLQKAPPLTKAVLREQTDALVPSGRLFSRHTAGTSGTPTHILLSTDELARMLAVRDHCYRHYGFRLGDREGRVWGRPAGNWKARLKDRAMNRRIFHPAGNRALAEVKALLNYRPVYLYGYSSLILEAARIIEANELEVPPVRCVVCTAEAILPVQKKFLEKVFRAPVAEEYGSTEFDIIAFECADGHRHLLNPWLVVESGNGDCRITDVSRTTQSIVRYELGDALQIGSTDCREIGADGTVEIIEGRSAEQFAYLSEHEKFHAVEFGNAFEEFMVESGRTFVFAVIQRDYGVFHVEVEPDAIDDKDSLVKSLKAYFLRNLNASIEVVIVPPDNLKRENFKTTYFINEIGKA